MRDRTVRRIATAALCAAVALLVGLPVLWLATRPERSVGSLAAVEAALAETVATTPAPQPAAPAVTSEPPAATTAPPSPPPPPRPATTADAATTAPATRSPSPLPVATRDARIGRLRPAWRATPRWLRIDGIEVSAPVVPLGVDPDGSMSLPFDSTTVAWYRYGPSPGQAGSAVLAAHVDWTDGPGPFYRLRELRPGDRITVAMGDGSARAFRVAARRVFEKQALPEIVWKRRGKPVLTLITCGGAYDPVRRHYDENVVVFALPA